MSKLDELERLVDEATPGASVAVPRKNAVALLQLARAAAMDIASECGARARKENRSDCPVCPALRAIRAAVETTTKRRRT